MDLEDFKKKDFYGADEHFGVEYDKTGSTEKIVQAFKDEGVTIEDFFRWNPELAEKYEAKINPVEAPENVIVTEDFNQPIEKTGLYPEEKDEIELTNKVIAQAQTAEQFLVKMRRKNPLFEIGKYRFTQEHPFAVVDAPDLNRVLSEEGMTIATPDEATEYYN